MTTDNGSILSNAVGRSMFGLHKPRKTTQRVGVIGVNACEIALPNETIALKRGSFYELKPTTNRIASSCEAHNMSVSVPFRSVIRYWDEFISKGDLIVQNGAMNVPFIQHREDNSVYQLPYTTPADIIGCFLASVCQSDESVNPNAKLCFMSEVNAETTIDQMPDGNKQDFTYNSVNASALHCRTPKYYDTTFSTHPDFWWLPRLIGYGYDQSGVNINLTYNREDTPQLIGWLHFQDQNSANLARLAYAFCRANNTGTTFDMGIQEVTAAKVWFYYDTTTERVYYGLAVGENGYAVEQTMRPDRALFYVVAGENDTAPYGTIELVSQDNFYDDETEYTGRVVPMLFTSAEPAQQFCASVVIQCLLNRPSLLGYGSLMESFGHHLFEPKTMYDIATEYSMGTDYSVSLGYAYDATFDVLNEYIFKKLFAIDEWVIQDKVNIIPYLCYQKTCTDRFLLDHEVLSNNTGEDSAIDFEAKFDSPYWRNNMVPTMWYGHPSKDEDGNVLHRSSFYQGNTWYFVEDGSPVDNSSVEQQHYTISVNSMLTIFLDRGVLLSMDVFTKNWQKENRNVQNILDMSGYGVNNEGTIQAKQFLLAKKLCQYVMYGNTDQLANQVIERHFGVNDVPTNHRNVIVLDMERNTLDVQDVLNQGGGLDQEGNAMALGDKVSIMTNQIQPHQVFECYEKEFSYILNLHWFSLEYERYNVPNPNVHILEKIQAASLSLGDVRRAFQIVLFPEFQSTGDEMLSLDDVECFAPVFDISWTNKNNTLKDGYCEYLGEWKNRFLKQIWSPYQPYRCSPYAPSLTYGYLQPIPTQYDLHLQDKFGDAFLCAFDITVYKKSIMTKSNEVGLVGL